MIKDFSFFFFFFPLTVSWLMHFSYGCWLWDRKLHCLHDLTYSSLDLVKCIWSALVMGGICLAFILLFGWAASVETLSCWPEKHSLSWNTCSELDLLIQCVWLYINWRQWFFFWLLFKKHLPVHPCWAVKWWDLWCKFWRVKSCFFWDYLFLRWITTHGLHAQLESCLEDCAWA